MKPHESKVRRQCRNKQELRLGIRRVAGVFCTFIISLPAFTCDIILITGGSILRLPENESIDLETLQRQIDDQSLRNFPNEHKERKVRSVIH